MFNKQENQIDINDMLYATERFGVLSNATPCPVDKYTGKINPHVSRFTNADGETVSIFHIKPIYYEHTNGSWRPLYEVSSVYANHRIVFEYESLPHIHPRYIDWLQKRMKLIGGEVLIKSPISNGFVKYDNIVSSIHRLSAKPTIGLTTTTVYPDPNPETTTVDGILQLGTSNTFATQW
jgi:hypothetical protein